MYVVAREWVGRWMANTERSQHTDEDEKERQRKYEKERQRKYEKERQRKYEKERQRKYEKERQRKSLTFTDELKRRA